MYLLFAIYFKSVKWIQRFGLKCVGKKKINYAGGLGEL